MSKNRFLEIDDIVNLIKRLTSERTKDIRKT